jgi:acyl-CoA thioesterase FadM
MHVGWPRVSCACEFIGPIRFEDELELRLRVTRLGEKSFSYEVDFMLNGRRMAPRQAHERVLPPRADGMKSHPDPRTSPVRLAGAGANVQLVSDVPADAPNV